MSKISKAIAAFFGGGVPSYIATLLTYWLGATAIAPSVLQSAIVGVLGGLVAAITVYFAPANAAT